MGHGAGAVADDLHLDVAGVLDQLLDVDVGDAEAGLRLGPAPLVRGAQVPGRRHLPHAPTAATGHRLHHDGTPAEAGHERLGLLEGDGAAGARQHRHAAPLGQATGGGLVAAQVEDLGRRSDEDDPRGSARPGEGGPLGEEAVAGVDRVGAVLDGEADDLVEIEVGGGAPPLERDALGGATDVQRRGVVGGVHGDGVHTEVGGGAEDPHRDLAAVGHEQTLHGRQSTIRRHARPNGAADRRSRGARQPVDQSPARRRGGRPRGRSRRRRPSWCDGRARSGPSPDPRRARSRSRRGAWRRPGPAATGRCRGTARRPAGAGCRTRRGSRGRGRCPGRAPVKPT